MFICRLSCVTWDTNTIHCACMHVSVGVWVLVWVSVCVCVCVVCECGFVCVSVCVFVDVNVCECGFVCVCVVCECGCVWMWICVCVCVCVCVWCTRGFHFGPALKWCYLWFSQNCGWRWQSFGYDTVLIVNSLTTIRRSLLSQSSGYSNKTDISNTLKMKECPLKSR